ncbi:MAG: hypothetical protein H6829_04395 [Planctomycetes bacterium]|nr:hypothetical protein [Planctomycetota bacterium]
MSDFDIIDFDLSLGGPSRPRRRALLLPWLWRGMWIVLGLLVVGRASLSLWLPPALKRMGHHWGLELAYEHLDLSLLGGQVTLRGLTAQNRDAKAEDEPLVAVDYAILDLSLAKLLRGQLRIHRAEIDGGRMHWVRDSAGHWNTEALWNALASESEGAPNWLDRAQWNDLRLQDIALLVRDESQTPVQEIRTQVDMTLADGGYLDRPMRIELRARAKDWLDGLLADATVWRHDGQLEATAQLELFGLRKDLANRWLAPLGAKVDAASQDLRFQAQTTLRYADAQETAGGSRFVEGPLLVRDLLWSTDHRPALMVGTLDTTLHAKGWADWNLGATRLANAEIHLERPLRGDGSAGNWSLAGGSLEPGSPLRRGLAQFSIERLDSEALRWFAEDETTSPPTRLAGVLEGNVEGLAFARASGWQPMAFDLQVPPSRDRSAIQLAGSFQPGSSGSLDVKLAGARWNPSQLAAYLEPLGLRCAPDLTVAADRMRVAWVPGQGATQWDVVLERAAWFQGSSATTLEEVTLERAVLASDTWRLGSLRLRGGSLAGGRTPGGEWYLAGLQSVGLRTTPAATWGPQAMRVDEAQLDDLALSWEDRRGGSQANPSVCHFDALRLTDWAWDRAQQPGPLRGRWDGNLAWPGHVANGRSQGQFLAPQGDEPGRVIATVDLKNWQDATLLGWLAERGVDLDWIGHDVQASGQFDWRSEQGGGSGSLQLREVRLAQGDQTLWELQDLDATGLDWSSSGWTLAQLSLNQPVGPCIEQPNGSWTAFGWRGIPALGKQPFVGNPAGFLEALPIQSLEVQGARIKVQPTGPPDLAGVWTLDGRWERLAEGGTQAGWKVDTEIGVQGSLERGQLAGEVHRSDQGLDWDLALEAEGLVASPWTRALLAPLVPEWQSAHLQAKLRGQLQRLESGALRGNLQVRDGQLSDGDPAHTLFALPALDLVVDRWDAGSKVARIGSSAIGSSSLAGLSARIRRDARGNWHALGMQWPSLEPDPARPIEASVHQEDPQAVPTWLHALDSLADFDGALGPHDWRFEDIVIEDALRPGAPSLQAQGHWTAVQAWSSPPAPGTPSMPYIAQVTGRLLPVLEAFELDGSFDPLAPRPALDLTWRFDGIQGAALGTWWPSAWSQATPTDLQGARSSGHLEAKLDLPSGQRRWSRLPEEGFGIELQARDADLQANALADPLCSIGTLEARATSIVPATGTYRWERLLLADPELHTWRDGLGWHALGLTVANASEQTPATASPSEEPEPHRLAALSVERIQIQGAQWDHEDRTVEPSIWIPIRGGEAEILHASLGDPDGALPMRLQASADSAKVRAPMRAPSNAVDPTVAGSLESRNAFDRLEARARVTLGPAPEGWFQLDVVGLELAPLRGWLAPLGLRLEDGVLDMRNTLRFQGEQGLAVDTRSTLEHLFVRPLPGSHVERDLGLRHDWDSTLASLRDGEGRIQVPLRFEVSQQVLSRSTLRSAARRAFTELARTSGTQPGGDEVRTAAASAPIESEVALRIVFVPGLAVWVPEAEKEWTRWARSHPPGDSNVWVLEHRFGALDLERAEALSSPPPASLMELLESLRRRKADLAQRYVSQAADARARLQYGTREEADASRKALIELNRQRAQTERAIDHVLGLLAPGAERRQERRTRESAMQLAVERQQAVLALLRREGWSDAVGSIECSSAEPEAATDSPNAVIELRSRPRAAGRNPSSN